MSRRSAGGGASPRSSPARAGAWDRSFHGSSNGFRKGKSKQTSSQGSDTSRHGLRGSSF